MRRQDIYLLLVGANERVMASELQPQMKIYPHFFVAFLPVANAKGLKKLIVSPSEVTRKLGFF